MKKLKPYLIYTGIFIIMCVLVLFNFIKFGKSLIREGDGFYQHFVFMYNYNEIIRSIFSNLSNGIPLFSWEMGLGLDIIGQYSYYVIGDIFTYITLLFSNDKSIIAYNFTIILRMFFAGITFIAYAKYKNKSDNLSIIGGIMYAFCSFTLVNGILHPYFINATIIFPLMLLAVDKLIKEDKMSFFIFIIFMTAISNYYFFYKITVITYLYSIIKIMCENKNNKIKTLIKKLMKITLCYIVGVLMSSIILLPTIYAFLNSDRFASQSVMYNLKYYENLLVGGKGFSTVFWVPTIFILTIPSLVSRFKENKTNIILFIIESIMLLVPFIGSLMNGFSFPINRWSFMYIFLLIYLFISLVNEDYKYSTKEMAIMVIVSLIYISLVLIFEKIDVNIAKCSITFLILYITLILLNNVDINIINKLISRRIFVIISILICLNIIAYSEMYFGIKYDANIKNFFDEDKVMEIYSSGNGQIEKFDEAIKKIKKSDDGFYRVGEITKYSKNESLLYNYKSLNSYLSVGNGYIGKLSREILNKYYEKVDALNGLDNRTKITTLLANKYYITTKEKNYLVPYGYVLKDQIESDINIENPTQIYENNNALPIAVFYDNYTLRKDYDNLTALEKEQIILDTAVIEENINEYKIKKDNNLISNIKNSTTRDVPYSVIEGNEYLKDKVIETVDNNQFIKLNIKRIKNSELYLSFENLEYIPYTIEELKTIELGENYTKIQESEFYNKYKDYDPSSGFNINIYYNNLNTQISVENKNTSAYFVNIPDQLINLGYLEEHSGNIKIAFSKIGKYKFDSLKIIAVSMDKYDKSIKKLKNNTFKLKKYDSNYLKGSIKTETSGILQFSVPYTSGWTAYVDGEKVETINVNTAFIGIPLKKGKHEIYLKYETPYLKYSIVMSIVGFIIFSIIIIYEKRNRKEQGG